MAPTRSELRRSAAWTGPAARIGTRAAPAAVALGLALAAAGCGSEGAPGLDGARATAAAGFDSDRARDALVAALDAWKRGAVAKLARATPPIRFADDDLAGGLKLADYELVEPDAPIEPLRGVHVILSLRDARGATIRREAHYQVTLHPSPAVLRADP